MAQHARAGAPLLDGYAITTAADAWLIRPLELRSAQRLATGRVKTYVLAAEPGAPETDTVLELGLRWSVYQKDPVLQRMLADKTRRHTLVLWRTENLVWRGNGSRRHFRLPRGWTFAVDGAPAVPIAGLDPLAWYPQLRLAPAGEPMPIEPRTAADYDAGEPPSGAAWWQRGTGAFKLGEAVAAGAPLYGDVVPAFRVVQAPRSDEVAVEKPRVEPFALRFLEHRLEDGGDPPA